MDQTAYLPDTWFGFLGMAHHNATWECMRSGSRTIIGGPAACVIF